MKERDRKAVGEKGETERGREDGKEYTLFFYKLHQRY